MLGVFGVMCPLFGALVLILMSPLFDVFSRESLVKETAATSGKFSLRII